jgi:hypothetical protein
MSFIKKFSARILRTFSHHPTLLLPWIGWVGPSQCLCLHSAIQHREEGKHDSSSSLEPFEQLTLTPQIARFDRDVNANSYKQRDSKSLHVNVRLIDPQHGMYPTTHRFVRKQAQASDIRTECLDLATWPLKASQASSVRMRHRANAQRFISEHNTRVVRNTALRPFHFIKNNQLLLSKTYLLKSVTTKNLYR